MKKCSKCGEEKPQDAYGKRENGKRRADCKACVSKRAKKWREANPERAKANVQRWHETHPDRVRAAKERYYKNNRPVAIQRAKDHYRANAERKREDARQWRQDHPEKVRGYGAARRARVKGALSSEVFTREEIYERDRGICQRCKKHCPRDDWELDHKVSLHYRGPHSRANVQVLCVTCNRSKGAGLDIRRWEPGQTRATRLGPSCPRECCAA